jgi:autotransporter-associated beta strand protein
MSGGAATHNFDWEESGSSNTNVLVLTNPANTFRSTVRPVFGVIGFTSDGALGDAANLIDFSQGSTTGASGIRFAADGITLNHGITTSANKLIDVPSGNTGTIASVMTGAGTFTKTGAGKLVFTGANTNTGSFIISAGTAQVDSTFGASATNTVSVNSGGTLSGNGTVARPTNINSGGTVAPGASAGVLTLRLSASDAATTTTMAGGGKYAWEVNNAAGTAGVNWDLLLMGQLSVTATGANRFIVQIRPGGSFLSEFDPNTPAQWKIGNYVVANVTNGFDTTKFTVDDSAVPNLGGFYVSSQAAGDGTFDLELNYVPEPASGTIVGLGVAALGLLKRRRRSGGR